VLIKKICHSTLGLKKLSVCWVSTPGGTRTPNPLIRSQMLYPIEPQAHGISNLYNILIPFIY
jgi:hypothetical protein